MAEATIRGPQMSDAIQSAEELISNIRDCDYMEGDWSLTTNDAIKAIEARDADIRADETRKQSERYAACIEDIKSRINLDINTFSACRRSTVGHFRSLMLIDEALADLEAPK
jgi:hypothetical protein